VIQYPPKRGVFLGIGGQYSFINDGDDQLFLWRKKPENPHHQREDNECGYDQL
jgi:hypothetical protein